MEKTGVEMKQRWRWRYRGKWYKTYQWDSAFSVKQRDVWAVMDVEYISVIMSHRVLGSWRFGDDIPNVPAPTEDKFLYKRKILFEQSYQSLFASVNVIWEILWKISMWLEREDTFKTTLFNDILYENSNHNCLRVEDIAMPWSLIVKLQFFHVK